MSPRIELASVPYTITATNLRLPFGSLFSGSAGAFSITHNGTLGPVGSFEITNASNSSSVLEAITNGAGAAVHASNTGIGGAGYFEITEASNTKPALEVFSNGDLGSAVQATANGTGGAGLFNINNPSNSSPALEANTTGTGPAIKTNGTVEVGDLDCVGCVDARDLAVQT